MTRTGKSGQTQVTRSLFPRQEDLRTETPLARGEASPHLKVMLTDTTDFPSSPDLPSAPTHIGSDTPVNDKPELRVNAFRAFVTSSHPHQSWLVQVGQCEKKMKGQVADRQAHFRGSMW